MPDLNKGCFYLHKIYPSNDSLMNKYRSRRPKCKTLKLDFEFALKSSNGYVIPDHWRLLNDCNSRLTCRSLETDERRLMAVMQSFA